MHVKFRYSALRLRSAFGILGAVAAPFIHEVAALLEQISAPIRSLNRAWNRMRERGLTNFPRVVGLLSRPISKSRAEAVRHNRLAVLVCESRLGGFIVRKINAPQELEHRHVRERHLRGIRARKDELAI